MTILYKVHILALAAVLCVFASIARGQDGHHGAGHGNWHGDFYQKLIRKDTKTSCCNLADCRPTSGRPNGDHYEVKVDGDWVPVPKGSIQDTTAPDLGWHVCAPPQVGQNKGKVFCVVMPPEA